VIGFESRFSQTTLTDFRNNLLSAQYGYTGALSEGQSGGQSLSALIAENDPELDAKVKQQMEAAIAAIDAVPAPIETQLSNSEAFGALSNAQITILTLMRTMEEEVLPIVQS
jgi:hypothetical protein